MGQWDLHESSFMKFGFEMISIRLFENETGYVCDNLLSSCVSASLCKHFGCAVSLRTGWPQYKAILRISTSPHWGYCEARMLLVTKAKKSQHIIPVLRTFRWLPSLTRINKLDHLSTKHTRVQNMYPISWTSRILVDRSGWLVQDCWLFPGLKIKLAKLP